MRRRASALAISLALASAPAGACGIELVLAVDVSRSVVNPEYDQQMGGLAAAFRDREIIDAITSIPGGIAVTVFQWSGPESQMQTIPWRLISTPGQIAGFADAIAIDRRRFFAAYTAIGEALWHANALSAGNPWACDRRVIDVSGDGVSNRGRWPREIADALAANGVTVNALVIAGGHPDPVPYYREEVIAGPSAFIVVADGFADYARAIREKLLRELAPAFAQK